MDKFVCVGIDIGSVTTKVVILHSRNPDGIGILEGGNGVKVLARAISPTGAYPQITAQRVLEEVLRQAGLSRKDIGYIVSTGYGRRTIDFGNRVITEISAAAKGVSFLNPSYGKIRTVIDLGGQDSKVIALDEKGEVLDFAMNDRCAAGTGRFLEIISNVLEVGLEDLARLSLNAESSINISSICSVFAETEVVSLIAQGRKKEDIIAGIHASIAQRICGMLVQIRPREIISFIGGGAKNLGLKKAIEDRMKMEIYIPDEPQFIVALGAALFAKESL